MQIEPRNKFRGANAQPAVSGVYGLVDPREPDRVRYVGSAADVAHRVWVHGGAASRKKTTLLGAWLRSLHVDGVRPVGVLLLAADIPAASAMSSDGMRERDDLEAPLIAATGADLNMRLGAIESSKGSTSKFLYQELRTLRARVRQLEEELAELKAVLHLA